MPLEELIENIDIGGPAMIRSAAKNCQDVAVVVSPADYQPILDNSAPADGSPAIRNGASRSKAFRTTADYDAAISARLEQMLRPRASARRTRHPGAASWMDLRYGENPHQQAALYGRRDGASRARSNCTARSFRTTIWWIWMRPGSWLVNFPVRRRPSSSTPIRRLRGASIAREAYRKALECDPVSAFGGVIGINRDGGRGDRERNREDFSWRPSPRRTIRRRRWRFSRRRRICV